MILQNGPWLNFYRAVEPGRPVINAALGDGKTDCKADRRIAGAMPLRGLAAGCDTVVT